MSERVQRVLASLSDRYTAERPLGGGGMAAVFLAADLRHGRRVALKVFDPERVSSIDTERFLREIRVTAGLQHPHILPLLDSGGVDGVPYYVTPYVEGETLRARLDRELRLPLEDVVALTRELADALDYAHGHGVVHRDIKPANILLSGGHAMVADFGVARAVGGADDGRLTHTGTSVGTPLYMSPEQAGGARELDGRADEYALGCVVFEMLGGAPPFTGPTGDSVAYQHLAVPAPPVTNLRPGLPAGIAEAIGRALAKAPADRHATLGAFARALETAAAAHDRTPAPASAVALPSGGRRRAGERWVAPIVVITLALAIGLGLWIRRERRGASERPVHAIAVLPLEDLTGDEARLVFADGMTEELITELSKIRSIRVSARSAVMRYRESRASLRTIAHDLHVDALVEGSVVRAGGRIRITARLIDPAREQERWSESYERELRDVLALQAEVARAVAGQLKAKLTPEEVTRLASARPVDPAAHEAALRGFALLDRMDGTNYRKAIDFFEQATGRDPAYATAWAGLADAYYYLSSIYLPAAEAMPRARAAALHALEIDPDLAAAHATLAMVRAQYDFEWTAADSAFRRAIALNPSLARGHAYYAFVLWELGRFDESEAEWRKAIELDPFSLYYLTGLGSPFIYSGRYAEATAVFLAAIARDSTYAAPRYQLALAYSEMGRHDEAITQARRAVVLSDASYALSVLGSTYARAGRKREALETLDRLLHRTEGRVQGVYLARVYAALGRKDEAFAALERSVRDRDEDVLQLAVDSSLAPLRGDPRFHAMLRRMNLER